MHTRHHQKYGCCFVLAIEFSLIYAKKEKEKIWMSECFGD